MSLIVIDTEDKIDAFLEDNVEIINIDLTLSAQTSSKINRYLVDATHSTDKDEFDKKYLNLIASLGRSYNSKYWWANSISEKNEISSQFYQRLFYLHRIAQHLDQPNLTRMLVLSSDKEFIHYLQNINFPCDNIEAPSTKHFVFKKNARNLVRLLCKVLLIFLREISRLCLSRRYLSKTILKIKKSKRLLIIKTIIDRRNYKSGRYVDSYYGRLLEYLKKKDVPFVLVGELVQDYSKNLKKIAREGAYSLLRKLLWA
jgi:uncharacterized protein involved in tolerance to divalent cations